jgi:hypothetical protein
MQVEMAEDLKLNGMGFRLDAEGLSHQRKAQFLVRTIPLHIHIMHDVNGEYQSARDRQLKLYSQISISKRKRNDLQIDLFHINYSLSNSVYLQHFSHNLGNENANMIIWKFLMALIQAH